MSQIKLGDYLFQRLKQLGIKSVFGVPGGVSDSATHFRIYTH